MKRTEFFLIVVTLINLGLVSTRLIKMKGVEAKESKKLIGDQRSILEENLFFHAMLDENQTINSGIELPREPNLVLRFSFRNCDICRNSALFEFKRLMDLTKSNRLKAIGSFMSPHDLKIFQETERQLSFNIANVSSDYFGLELEREASEPFFFVLFPDGSARHIFIPLKEDVPRTRRYLEIIRQKYFSNDQKNPNQYTPRGVGR